MKAKSQHLYRLFNSDRELLYVGVTNDPGVRFGQHSRSKGWWNEVAYAKREPFTSRTGVLAAEQATIKIERPRHNLVHAAGSASRFQTAAHGALAVARWAAPNVHPAFGLAVQLAPIFGPPALKWMAEVAFVAHARWGR